MHIHTRVVCYVQGTGEGTVLVVCLTTLATSRAIEAHSLPVTALATLPFDPVTDTPPARGLVGRMLGRNKAERVRVFSVSCDKRGVLNDHYVQVVNLTTF